MTEPLIPQSIFPDLPREAPAVDKDGNFSLFWSLGFSSLFQALQSNYKNEGILIPPLTQIQADNIKAIYTAYIGAPLPVGVNDISGQMIFNTSVPGPQIFIITYTGSNVNTVDWYNFTITPA
jgi:hypothetical protein